MSQGNHASTIHLLRQLREGDGDALANLFEQFGERLLLRIRLMMGPAARAHAESSDFLHDLFVDLAADVDRYELASETEFLRLAVGMARNNIRQALRKQREKRMRDFSASSILWGDQASRPGAPLEHLITEESAERLVQALEQMTSTDRQVIELRDLEELSYSEIAVRMEQRSVNAVQLLHARALTKLSARIQSPTRD